MNLFEMLLVALYFIWIVLLATWFVWIPCLVLIIGIQVYRWTRKKEEHQ
ncbi:MAG: hypothetical protein P8M80_06720 [Pirellulaceae bacterium]|nr:hypothetical protein [Pirellulaceae bacterium]